MRRVEESMIDVQCEGCGSSGYWFTRWSHFEGTLGFVPAYTMCVLCDTVVVVYEPTSFRAGQLN